MGNESNLYQSLASDPRLRGCKPNAIIIDDDNQIYISIKDAAVVAKLSVERLRGLVSENRLTGFKPGGRDLFVSLDSVDAYLTDGRQTPGRPQKQD